MPAIDRNKAERRIGRSISTVLKPRQQEFGRLDPNTFAENGINPNFWVTIRNDMEDEAKLALLLLFIFASGRQGIDEDAARARAATFAAGRASTVASRFTANSQKRVATFRGKLQQRLAKDLPIDKLMMRDRATVLFGKDRVSSIAQMETTNILTKTSDLSLELKNAEAGEPLAFKNIWVLDAA